MKRRLFAIIVAMTMVISILPVTALAEDLMDPLPDNNTETQIDSVDLSETEEGEANSLPEPSDGVITLTEDVTLAKSWEVTAEATITLDLNGHTLSVSDNAAVVKNYGELTIKDTSEEQDGKITGYRGVDNYGALTLSGGTIEGTTSGDFSGCIFIYANETTFTMSGGKVASEQAPAIGFNPNKLSDFTQTQIEILGGSLGTIALNGKAAELTVGSADNETDSNSIQIEAITTPTNKWSNNHYTINLKGGTIGLLPAYDNVTYTGFNSLIIDTTNCPGGYHFENKDGGHKLVQNTDPVAQIDKTSYYYLPDAVAALQEDDTLTLLADYNITNSSEALTIDAANVTIDLNGHDITVTGDVSNPPVTCKAKTGTFKITNSGSEAATIKPVTGKNYTVPAVQISSGSAATVEVDTENVNLTNGIRLTGGRIEDTPANRELVAVGGSCDGLCTITFGDAEEAEGYIYAFGDLDAIVTQAGEGVTSATVTLLGDADTSIKYSTSKIAMTVDLAGHTVAASSGNSLISIPDNADGTTLTVKNGTINAQGISAASVLSENCVLTLEKLSMTSGGDFGIATNGSATGRADSSAGLKLTLTNCSLQNTINSESGTVGIYFPVHNGTLSINNSQITQFDMGVQAISGSTTITGDQTEITGSGRVIENDSGDGPRFDGAALSVLDREGYGDLVTVKIEAGSFSTPADSDYGAVHVSAFKNDQFTGDFENNEDGTQTVQVSGGTFSAPIDPELCETGSAPLVKADGSCSIIATPSEGDSHGYLEQDGTYYEDEDAMAATHVAKVGDKYYSTLADAISAAQSGDTVKLMKSTTGNPSVSISDGRSITLNMNGFDAGFSFQNNISVLHGGLNITGSGKLYEESPWFAPVMLYGSDNPTDSNYTTVTVGEDVILEGWAGLFIDLHDDHPDNAYGIAATVYGTLKSVKDTSGSGGHALYINGTIKATEGNVPKITLNGATLTTELGNGMYLAGYAETTIIDSSITSTGEDSTGIEIRAGKLSISGNTKIEASTGEVEVTPNGNGSTSANVAIAVAQHTTKLPIEVTVTGGTFIGGAALNEMNPQGNEQAAIDQVEISVEGGNFVGIVNSEDISGFVAGGNFSDSVNRKYLDDTLNAELKRSSGETPYSYYTDVEEALEHASAGDEVIDLSDPDESAEPITAATVTYDNGGHGTAPAGHSIIVGEEIELKDMRDADGYVFMGWSMGGDTYQPGDIFTVTAARTTFTAVWELKSAPVEPVAVRYIVEHYLEGRWGYELEDTEFFTGKIGDIVTAQPKDYPGYRYNERISTASGTLIAIEDEGDIVTLKLYYDERTTPRPSGGSSEPSYTVSVEDLVNGTVETDPRRAQEGEEVTITVTPDDGYELDTLTVTDRDGDEVEVTEERNGTFTFTMPDSRVTIEATFVPVAEDIVPEIPTDWANPYADVAANAWYYDAVAYVTANGLMNGTSATTFAPNVTTTRAMIWTVLARMNGQSVDGGTPWYTLAQSWAMRANVSDGTNPTDPISREELATMLYRAAGSPAVSGNLLSYPDGGAVSAWAESAMLWATQNGIISGIDGMLTPQGQATRAQVATMLMRFREVVIH